MKLRDYVDKYCISVAQFAIDIGVNVSTVYNYTNDEKMPELPTAIKIVKATGGKVTYRELVPAMYKHKYEQKRRSNKHKI